MSFIPKLRTAIEHRLSLPKYASVWKCVNTAFANEVREVERDYWDFALGLPDAWASMAKAPAKQVESSVIEIAMQARSLAYKIHAFSPELKTFKGFLDVDIHTFIADDLIEFADSMDARDSPTEAMTFRPRSMALPTAERTYMARALTHFILSCGKVSGNPIPGRDSVVAMTVCALLDIGSNDEFDGKDVSDLTKDIVSHYREKPLR